MGSTLYTDLPCGTDYVTVAIMPKGAMQFERVPPPDAAIKAELERLSDQEDELIAELDAASARSGDDSTESLSLKMQIQALLESVRRQKAALIGRGLSPEEGEELVVESIK